MTAPREVHVVHRNGDDIATFASHDLARAFADAANALLGPSADDRGSNGLCHVSDPVTVHDGPFTVGVYHSVHLPLPAVRQRADRVETHPDGTRSVRRTDRWVVTRLVTPDDPDFEHTLHRARAFDGAPRIVRVVGNDKAAVIAEHDRIWIAEFDRTAAETAPAR